MFAKTQANPIGLHRFTLLGITIHNLLADLSLKRQLNNHAPFT